MRFWGLLQRKFIPGERKGIFGVRGLTVDRYCAVLVVFISNVGQNGGSGGS
jgi:hypothetical protein